MSEPVDVPRSTAPRRKQQFIRRIDSRYCLPANIEVIRVLASWQVPDNDGTTNGHYEYDVLYEEVGTDV
jgi:hypothetical protein